ncbi:hypothetical protein LOTGIDRAFT_114987 [Lottia gigantea]|uniref:tRNA (cytosine(38)-C(5))-methyltransferase n=1 Tax=Lottia gigantea TaxID=225164 RepID=V4AK43_LOTGI|nr:hypothetical protein LOTGIDRAFT_114987 [Lottia gigantea]ESO97462.1 hypothetical protein LOTGIDRAFT_114987 [Lottia gigantea]
MAASIELRVLELYSGIGGMNYSLKESGVKYEIIAAIDINTTANQIYQHNFPDHNLMAFGIEKLTLKQYEKWNINTILMSPPCQPFTRVGNKNDVNDIRTQSFLHILQLIHQCKEKPSYILVENVKGFEESEARNKLIEMLTTNHYHYQEFLLTPLQFGISNCRLRYYMIAKLQTVQFLFTPSSKILTSIPNCPEEWLKYLQCSEETDNPVSNKWDQFESCDQNIHQEDIETDYICDKCLKLKYFLESKSDDYFQDYLVEKKDFKWFIVMDIVHPGLKKSMCFTKRYGHYINGAGPILQMSHDLTCDLKTKITTLNSRDFWTEEETKIIEKLKLRYFTPREIANLLCFPSSFSFPDNLSRIQLYRCLGNSLNVHVVSILIRLLVLEKYAS